MRRQGLLASRCLLQRRTKIVMRFSRSRVQRGRAAVAGLGIAETTGCMQDVSEIIVQFGPLRGGGDRLAQQRLGLFGVSAPFFNEGQRIQSVRLTRVFRQQFTIDSCGFFTAPGGLQCGSPAQCQIGIGNQWLGCLGHFAMLRQFRAQNIARLKYSGED